MLNRPGRTRTCAIAGVLLAALLALWLLLPVEATLARDDASMVSAVDLPQSSPLTWLASRADGFNQSAEGVAALADFGGRLYAGLVASGPTPASLIWAYDDQQGWNPSSLAGFGGGNTGVLSLQTLDGTLYAGTSNPNGGQVWASGGEGWSHAADSGFDNPANDAVIALVAFRGRLFAGTRNDGGAQIWSFAGDQWKQVVSSGLNDAGNTAVQALVEHDGTLYAGTHNERGAQVWSSNDGTAWTVAASGGFGQASNDSITSMASFRGALYAAVGNSAGLGGQVWQYDPWADWRVSAVEGFATPGQPSDRHNLAVTALAVHEGQLFAGTANKEFGTQIWFSDGYGWWPSTKTGIGVGGDNHTTGALASYAGSIWAATSNSSHGAVVWRGAPRIVLNANSRYHTVTAPGNLYFDVQVINTLNTALFNVRAFDFWESTANCVYDTQGGSHLRWDVGDLAPGESQQHQFMLQTHSWCSTQSVTNTVRLEADNLAPLFAFAMSEVIAAPTPTLSLTPTPSPTASPTPRTAVTIELQQGTNGYQGALDTHLSQSQPTTQYCQEPRIRVGANQGLAGLIRFDLSSIPTGADVMSATLHLYGIDWAQGRNIQVGAYVVSRTVDICQASWTYASEGERWGAAGCRDVQTDRRPTPEVLFWTSGLRHWYHLDLSEVVRSWVNGTVKNGGLLLLGEPTESEIHAFASGQHAERSERPMLSISYYAPSAPTASPTSTSTQTSTPTPTHTLTPSATTSPTLACPDSYEPNDFFEEAWDIGWGGQVVSFICSPTDVDYYRADVGQLAYDAFSIVLRDLPADYDLYVYNMAQQEVARSAQPGLGEESVVAADTQVYIRVSSADGACDARHAYRLDVIPIQQPSATPTTTGQPTLTWTPTQTLPPQVTSTPTPTHLPPDWQAFLPVILSSSLRR